MSYTIKDLKEEIADLPDDMLVFHQSDPEGNSFSPCAGLDSACVVVKEDENYVVYDAQLSASDVCMTEKEWNKVLKKPRVAVIFPGY